MKAPLLAIAIALFVAGPAWSAPATAPANSKPSITAQSATAGFAMVMVHGKEVVRLASIKNRGAQGRADEVRKRLRMMLVPKPGAQFKPVKPSEVTVVMVDNQPVVRFRNQNVAAATKEDATLNSLDAEALAQKWATDLRSALGSIVVAKGQGLPQNTIVVATGQIRTGGGAGRGNTKTSPQPSASP